MKTYLFVIFLLASFLADAQVYKLYQTDNIHNQLRLNTSTGEIYQIQDDGQRFLVSLSVIYGDDNPGKFQLFKTQNMWTYILLDTHNGRLWQCQYSVEGAENRFCLDINPYELTDSEKSIFTIQPMTSMFQYYLLNEENGELWKFQWSVEGEDYRWIEKF
ncbi:MAG: hypothetical protein RJQ00_02775 [Vicingaceae bacterium]